MKTQLFFVLFCSLLLPFGIANAATLHLLIAADASNNDNVGRTVAADGNNIENLFREQIPPHQLNVRSFSRPNNVVSQESLFKAIDDLRAGNDDCIVVYYSGHGAYDEQKGQYLALSNGDQVLRSDILSRMKRSPARLNVLLTDCCNVRSDFKLERGILMKPPAVPKRISPLFHKLFFDASGIVDMTAAEKDSWGFVYPTEHMYDDSGDVRRIKASIFTWVFCQTCLQENAMRKSWNDLFSMVKIETNREFQKVFPTGYAGRDQTQRNLVPFAKFDVKYAESSGETPTPAVPSKPLRLGVRAANIQGRDGVEILEVHDGSPGKAAKMRIGEIIVQINGQIIRNEDDYRQAITDSPRTMKYVVEDSSGERFSGTVELREGASK